MKTRENFWNVYCFATNQMRDETAKDNGQTAAGISHDLIRNNELALSSARNLQFFLCTSLKKLFFHHKPTLATWSHLLRNQLPNWPKSECKLWKFTTVQVRAFDLSYKKYGSKTTNHSQLAWPFELHVKQTQRNIACDWLIFFSLSDMLSSRVWCTDPVFLIWHRLSIKSHSYLYISILPKPKSRKKNFSSWKR